MNIQKIQTSTRGFTLVELIVVITILVILGTIAFINLGGMSGSARDSQRTSDLNQINQQIMVTQAKSGLSYLSMVSGTGLSYTGTQVGGTGVIIGTDYAAGDANYTVLGIDATKMSDPSSAGTTKYKMGASTKAGGVYEIAAKLEENSTALVMGSYRARTTAPTATTTGTGTNKILLALSDAGKFYTGDYVTGVYTGTISSLVTGTVISLGTATQINSTGSISLATTESAGLIFTGSSAVVNKGTVLPY